MTDALVGALERVGLKHGVCASVDSNGCWSYGSTSTGRWYGSYATKGEALREGLKAKDLERRNEMRVQADTHRRYLEGALAEAIMGGGRVKWRSC